MKPEYNDLLRWPPIFNLAVFYTQNGPLGRNVQLYVHDGESDWVIRTSNYTRHITTWS